MLPTAMTGFARRRSHGRRSSATVAHTITVIATPMLPMMSNVVPLCGPASNSEAGPEGPEDALPEDADPSSAVLLKASLPASSMDVPYPSTMRAGPHAASRRRTVVATRSRRARAMPAITSGIHVIVG